MQFHFTERERERERERESRQIGRTELIQLLQENQVLKNF